MSEEAQDANQTWGQGIKIDLPPGVGWVLYTDNGLNHPYEQGMSAARPHGWLRVFPNEDTMRQYIDNFCPRNEKKHWLMWGVVESYTSLRRGLGDATSGGWQR